MTAAAHLILHARTPLETDLWPRAVAQVWLCRQRIQASPRIRPTTLHGVLYDKIRSIKSPISSWGGAACNNGGVLLWGWSPHFRDVLLQVGKVAPSSLGETGEENAGSSHSVAISRCSGNPRRGFHLASCRPSSAILGVSTGGVTHVVSSSYRPAFDGSIRDTPVTVDGSDARRNGDGTRLV